MAHNDCKRCANIDDAAQSKLQQLILVNAEALEFLPRCMQCRRGLAVRILFVCLSVTRVHCDKTVERFFQIYIPYERTFIPLF